MSAPEKAKPLGERIREARKAAGFTSQAALAQAIGTRRLHVNGWETGKHAPSHKYAQKLAAVLGGEPEHWMAQDGHGPSRRRDVAELAQRMETLAQSMEAGLNEVLGLLTEIRNAVAPRPSSPGDGWRDSAT